MLSGRSAPDAFAVLPTRDVERGSDEVDERELEPTSRWNDWPANDESLVVAGRPHFFRLQLVTYM
jgi:hypothetical protein